MVTNPNKRKITSNENKPRRKQVDTFIMAIKLYPKAQQRREMIRKIILASKNNIQDKYTTLAATKESDEDNTFITEGFNPPDNHGIDLLPIRLRTNP